MIDNKGKLFGLINIIDLTAILLVLFFIGGVVMVKSGSHKTSAEVAKSESRIEFDVFIRGQKMVSPDDLFKGQDKTFLTIRNVPYTALPVKQYSCNPWLMSIPHPENNTAVAIPDPSAPMTYDCTLTIKDKAIITDDGAVIGGNKIKIGLKVDIEGFNYRLPGVVTNIKVMDKK